MSASEKCEACEGEGQCIVANDGLKDSCPACDGTGKADCAPIAAIHLTAKRDATEVRKYALRFWPQHGWVDAQDMATPFPRHDNVVVLASDHAAAIARVEAERDSARRECDRLAGSLAACGVIAGCDDAESFNRWVIGPENAFFTDSNAAVNRLCVKRAELAEKVGRMREALNLISTGNRRALKDSLTRYEGLAIIEVCADLADAALKNASGTDIP